MDSEPSPFREVWVELPDGQVMYALINGEVGWLMYLRESGDAGFSSRNPEYDGPADAMVEYRLSNGQQDFYPRAWAYPVEVVERAMEYFRMHGARPAFVVWHDDSGGGWSQILDWELRTRCEKRCFRGGVGYTYRS